MGKIIVFGGANVDIIGKSIDSLKQYDSNPATINISFGGVARNIAQSCVKLEQDVYFATVFGKDRFGEQLRLSCTEIGMDCSLSKQSSNYSSSIYLAILNDVNEMEVAMCDMGILNDVDQEMIDCVLQACKEADVLVMDTNLSEEVIHTIMDRCPCPIYLDPISCAKTDKILSNLGKIHTFKPNRYEAEKCCGFEIKTKSDKINALNYFLDLGIKEIIISMAEEGCIAANHEMMVEVKAPQVNVVDVTGGGDGFMSGLISFRNEPFVSKLVKAMGVATLAITQEFTVHPECSKLKVDQIIKEYNMEENVYEF